MSDNAIEVKVGANASGVKSGMRDAGDAVEEHSGRMAAALREMSAESGEAVEHLTDKLREFATEQRSEGRLAGFMAGQIAQLGISSKGAAGEVTGFISAFAFGGVLGVGIEAIKIAIEKFNELGKEENAAAESASKFAAETEKAAAAIRDSIKAAEEAEGKKGEALTIQAQISAALREQEAAQLELNEAHKKANEIIARRQAQIDRIGSSKNQILDFDDVQKALAEIDQLEEKTVAFTERIGSLQRAAAPKVKQESRESSTSDDDQKEAAKERIHQAAIKRHDDELRAEMDAAAILRAVDKQRDDEVFQSQHTQTDAIVTAMQERLAIAKRNNDAALEADRRHWDEDTKIAKHALEEQNKQIRKQAQEEAAAVKQLASQFTDSMMSMADGSKTVAQASKQMAESVIKDLVNMAMKAIEQEILKLAGVTAADAAALPEQNAINVAKVTSASAVIGAQTAENSPLLDIPGYGPALALAEGAAMMGAAEAMFAPAASAAGGYDVPAGTDPLTQLHAREMVLPARYADMIRGMAASPSGGAQGGDIHVHTQDAHGMERTLKNNQGALIKTAARIQSNRRKR